MNDCVNAEMRDRLPDLLHDRLDAATRAATVAHVDGCVDCRAELELLRGVRAMLDAQASRAQRVDTSWVVGALPVAPKAPTTRVPSRVGSRVAPSRVARSRGPWSDWRIAAAVTMLVAGGSSFAVLERNRGIDTALRGDSVQVPAAAVAANATPAASTNGASTNRAAASQAPANVSPAVTPPTIASAAAPASPIPGAAAPRTLAASQDDGAPSTAGTAGRLDNLNAQQLKKLLNDIGNLEAIPAVEPEPVTLHVDPKASSSSSPGEEEL